MDMSTTHMTSRELANAIRFLAIDAVEKSKSGHPGAPIFWRIQNGKDGAYRDINVNIG